MQVVAAKYVLQGSIIFRFVNCVEANPLRNTGVMCKIQMFKKVNMFFSQVKGEGNNPWWWELLSNCVEIL